MAPPLKRTAPEANRWSVVAMSAPLKLKEATATLSALTDTLERMADRQDELEVLLWLASQFGLDATERAQLEVDVRAFREECFALAEGITAKYRRAA